MQLYLSLNFIDLHYSTIDENSPDECNDKATTGFPQSEVWVGCCAPTTDGDLDSSDLVGHLSTKGICKRCMQITHNSESESDEVLLPDDLATENMLSSPTASTSPA
jgi:hypothetical protein